MSLPTKSQQEQVLAAVIGKKVPSAAGHVHVRIDNRPHCFFEVKENGNEVMVYWSTPLNHPQLNHILQHACDCVEWLYLGLTNAHAIASIDA